MAKRIHGLWKHPLYNTYNSMIQRCYNKNRKSYRWYGARGISVCNSWRNSPQVFIDWAIGHNWKSGLQVDRINQNGNYEPNNCRIVTRKENFDNRRPITEVKKDNDLPIGVCFKRNRYQAAIKRNTKWYYLGSFDNAKDASDTYQDVIHLLKSPHYSYIIYLTLLSLAKRPSLQNIFNKTIPLSIKKKSTLPMGVNAYTRNGKVNYQSSITVERKQINLGIYPTAEEASDTYQSVRQFLNKTGDTYKKHLYYSFLLELNQNPEKYKDYSV